MKIILATHNKDKCLEMKEILGDVHFDLVTLDQFPQVGDIIEDGATLTANAIIKAKAVYNITKLPCIADDTGLEVDALNGAPGIYSARYAGNNCSYLDNVNKLLMELKNTPHNNRNAKFSTSIAYIDDNLELTANGYVKGIITNVMKGIGGFGYDPVFYVPSMNKTYAEMNIDEKNKISHRGIAIENMKKLLHSYFPQVFNNLGESA